MKKRKKVSLSKVKIKSFITTISPKESSILKGGTNETETTAIGFQGCPPPDGDNTIPNTL